MCKDIDYFSLFLVEVMITPLEVLMDRNLSIGLLKRILYLIDNIAFEVFGDRKCRFTPGDRPFEGGFHAIKNLPMRP